MSSWQIACSLFSALWVPVDFSYSGALMINGSAPQTFSDSLISVCAAASPSDPTPSLYATLSFALPLLSLSSLPPFFPVSEYNLSPPFQWRDHRFGLFWIAVGWSFVTQAAAVLSFGMVHMARGQGSGSVRTLSGCSTDELLLVSFGETDIMHCTHQSPDKYTLHRVALYLSDILGFWHLTNFETMWVCTCLHARET